MKYIILLFLVATTISCIVSVPHEQEKVIKVLKPVTLYSASWCGWCKRAKAFLKEKNIAYIEKDFDNPEHYQELAEIAKRLNYKGRLDAVPLFIIKDKIVVGFSPKEILCLLGLQKCSLQNYERVKTNLK